VLLLALPGAFIAHVVYLSRAVQAPGEAAGGS
jgi:hypothetical protein